MHKVAKSQEIQGFEKIKGDKNTMIKVLFLCHGNICRSTMAESVLTHLVNQAGLADQFEIDSAATSREEIGNPTHRGTVRKLNQVGIPVVPHRARQMTQADYEYYDYLIGMDSANIRNMNRMVGGDPEGKIYKLLSFSKAYRPDADGRQTKQAVRDIADPWYTGNFDETYDDVMEGCQGFLEYLEESGEIWS